MKLILLAENRTKQETIDHLVDGVQRVVPVHLDLSLISERYTLKSPIFTDLRSVAQRFLPNVLDEYLLILSHHPVRYVRNDIYSTVVWTGRDSTGNFLYDGSFFDDDRVILVGGDNFPSDNNVKLACHEVGHIFLNPIKGGWTEEGLQSAHCYNYVGDRRCIMNTNSESTKITKEFLETLYLGYCQQCNNTMIENKKITIQ